MEYSTSSFRFHRSKFHHLTPLFGLVRDELAEVSRRASKQDAAEIGELRFRPCIGKDRINFPV